MGDKAVVVGINLYPNAGLRGCVPDGKRDVAKLEGPLTFDPDKVQFLTDTNASTDNIREVLKWLAADTKAGDRRAFMYSGHGAQAPTINKQLEVDGLDEVICPQNFDWSDRHMLRDKELHNIFITMPPGTRFFWMSDSCHSGDLTRAIGNPHKHRVPRTFPTTPEIARKIRIAKTKLILPHGMSPVGRGWFDPYKPTQPVKPNPLSAVGIHVAFVPGCKSDQTSADTEDSNGNPCGALTDYWWNAYDANPVHSVRQICQTALTGLHKDSYDQTPIPEGDEIDKCVLC